MPKVPLYTLTWSPAREIYELYQTRDRQALRIVPDSPEWFAWLEQASSFAFSGKSGHYTARKETKQRGDRYWSAYLTTGEHLTKRYLGKSADLNLERLEYIAGKLRVQSIIQVPPPETLALARTDSEEGVTQHPIPNPRDTPLRPLSATKLYVPRPRTKLVPRTHLSQRLQQGLARPLTLVSAPAGFGKTTLLAQWLAESSCPVAWLSLEAEDNDPTRFLTYLIAALQTLDAQMGTIALEMLRTPQPPSPEEVLAVLVSDVNNLHAAEFVLVLDDYHVISSESIHRGMTFLLEHLPPQMHLLLATRADPPLPLARMRANGQLTEVRTADLRFDTREVGLFLQVAMGLDLETPAIALLEQRTEGWIAGLQLAALSLQGGAEVTAFLAAFGGSHRYVLDYLREEVLSRQPEAVQQFLLRTCILERLCGSLCDAVADQEGSQAMLEALERANLFVVPLDDERHWYRYHHLFAEVLHSHLQQAEATMIPELNRRASAWYEQQGLIAEAVQHALAAADVELAVRLIEPIALPLAQQGQISTVLVWIKALPEALVQTRPFLCVSHALLLVLTNQLEAAEARLRQAELGVEKKLFAEQAQIIMGYVFTARSAVVGFSGDMGQAISLAHQALDLLPEAETIPRAGALVITIRSYMVSGDVAPATEHEVVAANASIRNSGNMFSIMASSICLLARLHVLQGRLRQAVATFAQVEQVAPRREVLQSLFGSLFYHFSLGDLLCELNDLDAAERHLAQGMALIKETLTVEPFVAILGYAALARLQQARGSTQEANTTVDSLLRLAERRHFAPHMLPEIAAMRARLKLAQGDLTAAIRWADNSGLSASDDDVPYPREGMYLVFARVRIAQARDDLASPYLEDIMHLLGRLRESAEKKARMGSVLEILVLQALGFDVQDDRASALSSLEQALVLAVQEGYIRLFVDEGAPMRALLHHIRASTRAPEYVASLLEALGEQTVLNLPLSSPDPSLLAEPLTEREREVLQLLLQGASNREIASRLVLSVNTVKRHVYNLCGKLGVQSRMQVIIRARSLNLK